MNKQKRFRQIIWILSAVIALLMYACFPRLYGSTSFINNEIIPLLVSLLISFGVFWGIYWAVYWIAKGFKDEQRSNEE